MTGKRSGRYTDAEVLTEIREHFGRTGYMPTVRQLRDSLGFASTSTVQKHLSRLVDDGFLTRQVSSGPGSYHRYRLAE